MSVWKVRCLVTGATGYIGGRLAPRLLDRGLAVRAMARNLDKLDRLPWRDRAEVARGDLGNPDSLTTAFDGIVAKLRAPADATDAGRLRHSYRQGRAQHRATLDDYANMTKAALALHEVTTEAKYLEAAERLVAPLRHPD